MDVLLVNSHVKMGTRHASLTPPLGLAYLASVLLNNDYSVSIEDFNVSGHNPAWIRMVLERENPTILGISAHTETYLSGLEIAEIAKVTEVTIRNRYKELVECLLFEMVF